MAFVDVDGERLEYLLIAAQRKDRPTLVFLHEGLGSVALWRDFPARVAQATACRTLLWSRFGHGHSASSSVPRRPEYLHQEALQRLPALLAALAIERPLLIGHSDGASIAAVYSGSFDDARLAGAVLIAPHFFTEPEGLSSIAAAGEAYENSDLRQKLGKYHRDPDNAFYGWNGAWLDPDFKHWNIAGTIDGFNVPVLAIQGEADRYGTLAQVYEIERRSPSPVTLEILPGCGHSPHLEKPEATLAAIARFADSVLTTGARAERA